MSPPQRVWRTIGLQWVDRDDVGAVRGGLTERPVGTLLVVVVDVVDEQRSELAFVPDDCAVQQLVPQRSDPPFGVRVGHRRAWWCRDRRDSFGFEHGVERSDILAGTVMDDEPELTIDVHQELAGGLGDPWSGRAGGDPSEMHPSRADLDEEQHMEASQRRGVHAREVRREDPLRLGSDELCPSRSRPPGCRVEPIRPQDRPHRRLGDPVTNAAQLAMHAPVTPGWALIGESDGEAPDLGVSLVAGREQPSEAADDQVTEGRDEVHRRQTVSTHRAARNSPKRSGDGFPEPTGLLGSMGTVGDAFDNVVAESFFGTLQLELLDRQPRWESRQQLASAIFDWIECFYNPTRRHSYCGMLSPVDYGTTTAA
jgi:hypothetical protein